MLEYVVKMTPAFSIMQFKKFIRIVLKREKVVLIEGFRCLMSKKCRGSVTCSLSAKGPTLSTSQNGDHRGGLILTVDFDL